MQGRSESNPVVLPHPISAEDFGNFMKVLYPQCVFQLFSSVAIYIAHFHLRGTCSWFTLPKAVWISTLKLSNMWYFIHFRGVAIQRLSQKNDLWVVSPTEKIVLARTYKVPQWLLQGLQELAEWRVLVSHSDAKIIGFEAAFKLAHICFSGDKLSFFTGKESRVAAAFNEEFQELTKEASMYTPHLNQD